MLLTRARRAPEELLQLIVAEVLQLGAAMAQRQRGAARLPRAAADRGVARHQVLRAGRPSARRRSRTSFIPSPHPSTGQGILTLAAPPRKGDYVNLIATRTCRAPGEAARGDAQARLQRLKRYRVRQHDRGGHQRAQLVGRQQLRPCAAARPAPPRPGGRPARPRAPTRAAARARASRALPAGSGARPRPTRTAARGAAPVRQSPAWQQQGCAWL